MKNEKTINIPELFKKHEYEKIISLKKNELQNMNNIEKERIALSYYYLNRTDGALVFLANANAKFLKIMMAGFESKRGNIDSALKILNSLNYIHLDMREKIEYKLVKTEIFSNNLKQDKALVEINDAIKLAENKKEFQSKIYSIYRYLGIIYIRLNNFKMARTYCRKVIDAKEASSEDKGFAYRYLGIIHSFKYNYFDAIIYFNKSLSIFRTHNHQLGLMKTYTSISLSYINMGELEIGLFFAKKALNIAKNSKDKLSESKIYNRLGNLYILKNEYDTAFDYFKRDYDYTTTLENPILKGYSARNIGRLYKIKNDFRNAKKYLNESLNIFKFSSDIFNQLLTKMEILTIDFMQYDHEELEKAFKSLIRPLKAKKFEEMLANFYLKFSKICQEKKDYPNALIYINKSLKILKYKENIFRFVEALFYQGKLHYLLKHRRKALESLKECYYIMKNHNIAFLFQETIDLIGIIDENILINTSKEKAISVEEDKFIRELNKTNIIEQFKNYYIIGKSKILKKLVKKAEKLAKTDVSILIEGETGIGKEIFAKYIYYKSERSNKPFMAINCAAIPENLFESEIFGYKAGSFTGANKDRLGKIKAANGGLVFFDEIDKISKRGQAILLRFLEENEIYPVGSEFPEKVDVRVIFATNVDLLKLIEEDKFLPDLYYRISASNIIISPLRERKEDIKELINYYTKFYSKKYEKKIDYIEKAAIDLLMNYTWPGNVRELKHLVENLVILNEGSVIGKRDIKFMQKDKNFPTLLEYENEYILEVLKFTKGNKVKAAKILGIHRNSMNNKIEKIKNKQSL